MPSLNVQSFSQIVGNIAAAVQGAANAILDYSTGSVLKAIAEGEAGLALWLQGLILQVLLATRAATSTGSDVDSWMADFGLTRLASAPSGGLVVFSRFTFVNAGFVPVGGLVRTTDFSQTFAVVAAPTNPAWDAVNNGYSIAPGTQSVAVPVVNTVAGTAGNVAVGTITIIASAMTGIDTVTNAAAMTGGSDSESDAAFLSRFVAFIGSLSKGTKAALAYAVASLQIGAQSTITETQNPDGSAHLGFFFETVDDGTGVPSVTFVTAAAAAIEATRAVGVQYAVFPPVVIGVVISFTIFVLPGFTPNVVQGAAANAASVYTNSLPLGASLIGSLLEQYIQNSVPGIGNLQNLAFNGGDDIIVKPQNVVKANQVVVTLSTTLFSDTG